MFTESFGTGIALSGNLNQAYQIYAQRSAAADAARAAARKKAQEDDEKAIAKVEDIGLKDNNKYTRFYQPLAKKAYADAINKAYEMKTKYPNTWQNMVPELAYNLKSELSGYANASQNQTDLEKLSKEGYIVPQEVLQVFNDPAKYGNIDALRAVSPILEMYGGGVGEDGSVSIYPTKPHNMYEDVSKFNSDKFNFNESITKSGRLVGNVYTYNQSYSVDPGKKDAFTRSLIPDPSVRNTVVAKYQNQLLSLPPDQREMRINELIKSEYDAMGLGSKGVDMGVTSIYEGNQNQNQSKYFSTSDVVKSQYINMRNVSSGDPRRFLGISSKEGDGWVKVMMQAAGENKNLKVPAGFEDYYKNGKVVPYGNPGDVGYVNDIPGGYGFGSPGKKYTFAFDIVASPTGQNGKKMVLRDVYEQNDEGYSVIEIKTGGPDSEEVTVNIPQNYKPSDIFTDESGSPVTFAEIQRRTENRASSGTPIRARMDDNGKKEVLVRFRGKTSNSAYSYWLPLDATMERAVLQNNKQFWGNKSLSDWFGGSNYSQPPVPAPKQQKKQGQIPVKKFVSNTGLDLNGNPIK